MEAKTYTDLKIQEENLSKEELNQITPKQKESIFIPLNDVIDEEPSILFAALTPAPLPQSIQDIENFYNETASGNEVSHDGSSFAKINIRIHYPVHLAARDGDCEEIEYLINDGFGYDVNQKDARSVTPLHVAALFGQNEAVKTLIKHNAKVDIKGYEDHTPLQFAIHKKHYDVATTLVSQGADASTEDTNGINGLTILLDSFPELLSDAKHDEKAQAKLNSAFALLEAIIDNPKAPLFFNEIIEIENVKYLAPIPLPILLQFITTYALTNEHANKLIELTNSAQAIDTSNQPYIRAKDLLHRFPTGENYKVPYTNSKSILFTSEGHSGIATTALATESLQAFLNSPDFDAQNTLKTDIFASLHEIYTHAKAFSLTSSTLDTANLALDLYNQGKTVLLPSGWDGHFIDVILSKPQLLYVVANSGDRYHGESPDYDPDPAGINFYRMYEPDNISAQFMYNVLNNSDKTVLEFENAYEFGVFERIEEISRADQEYGNCGWESHRDAVEGLIYIELINRNISSDEAKALAADYYQEWDNFHGNFVIDRFVSENPLLPIEALFDIFNEIHLKENYTPADQIHAQKIADAIASDHYASDFQSWLKDSSDHDLSDKLMINILKMQHGIDVKQILEKGFIEKPVQLIEEVEMSPLHTQDEEIQILDFEVEQTQDDTFPVQTSDMTETQPPSESEHIDVQTVEIIAIEPTVLPVMAVFHEMI